MPYKIPLISRSENKFMGLYLGPALKKRDNVFLLYVPLTQSYITLRYD